MNDPLPPGPADSSHAPGAARKIARTRGARIPALHVLSDLHLGAQGLDVPSTQADIVVLAGDISRPAPAIDWASKLAKPVLYVPGNHEFYGGTISGTLRDLKARAQGTNVIVLDNDAIVLDGVRFLGTTLWTDFNLFGPGMARDKAIVEALAFMRDFTRIRMADDAAATMSVDDMEGLYRQQRTWLADALSRPFDGITVVITHHAPSPRSIHPRFAGSAINTCFVSDNESLMGADRVALWIHGHTHNSFDYRVKGTRVLCNPRGYMLSGQPENPDFRPDLVVSPGD